MATMLAGMEPHGGAPGPPGVVASTRRTACENRPRQGSRTPMSTTPTATRTRDSRGPRHRMAHWAVRRVYGHRNDISDQPVPDRGIHRILVVKISHTLGNTLLLTPLLQELEARFPGAEI